MYSCHSLALALLFSLASAYVCVILDCFPYLLSSFFILFFFSSRRRHTRCALVTGVQTCALPISAFGLLFTPTFYVVCRALGDRFSRKGKGQAPAAQIGRASCRERVCQYV